MDDIISEITDEANKTKSKFTEEQWQKVEKEFKAWESDKNKSKNPFNLNEECNRAIYVLKLFKSRADTFTSALESVINVDTDNKESIKTRSATTKSTLESVINVDTDNEQSIKTRSATTKSTLERYIPEIIKTKTRVVSVGCGPGPEIVAYINFLNRPNVTKKSLCITAIDQVETWKKYIDVVKRYAKTQKHSLNFKRIKFDEEFVKKMDQDDIYIFSFANVNNMDKSIWPELQRKCCLIIIWDLKFNDIKFAMEKYGFTQHQICKKDRHKAVYYYINHNYVNSDNSPKNTRISSLDNTIASTQVEPSTSAKKRTAPKRISSDKQITNPKHQKREKD